LVIGVKNIEDVHHSEAFINPAFRERSERTWGKEDKGRWVLEEAQPDLREIFDSREINLQKI